MALHLTKSLLRKAAACVLACGALTLTAPWVGALAALAALAWWSCCANRVRQAMLAPIDPQQAYVRIARDDALLAQVIDWDSIDALGAQLAARGFRALGDYTLYPQPAQVTGVASIYCDAAATTIVEIQYLVCPAFGASSLTGGCFVGITSLLGGNIRILTGNYPARASNFLMRGELDVLAACPGLGLLALLDEHARRLARLRAATGKAVSAGLSLARYLLAVREAQEQARRRLSAMSGLAIARAYDAFEAAPAARWEPPAVRLRATPVRALEELDRTYATGYPPPVFDALGA